MDKLCETINRQCCLHCEMECDGKWLETEIEIYKEDLLKKQSDKISDLEAKLEETEELNKKLAEHSQSVDKALDDSCDVIRNLKQQLAEKEKEETKRMEDFEKGCQEYYKSNQTAIAELNNILDTFAFFVNEEKESMVSPDGNGNLSLLEYIENRIDALKGER